MASLQVSRTRRPYAFALFAASLTRHLICFALCILSAAFTTLDSLNQFPRGAAFAKDGGKPGLRRAGNATHDAVKVLKENIESGNEKTSILSTNFQDLKTNALSKLEHLDFEVGEIRGDMTEQLEETIGNLEGEIAAEEAAHEIKIGQKKAQLALLISRRSRVPGAAPKRCRLALGNGSGV